MDMVYRQVEALRKGVFGSLFAMSIRFAFSPLLAPVAERRRYPVMPSVAATETFTHEAKKSWLGFLS